MINNEGEEMINDYAVQNEVFVGNRRYLFAIHKNDKEPQRFLKCQCYDDDLFRHYVSAVTSNDFVECMKLYKELERLFHCKGTEIRRMVNELRSKGVPICSSSRGYYYAENRSDIEETIAHLDGRVSKIKAAQDGLRNILKNYIGG